ncbi:MAG: Crp/Fnr family transcriptional regulator [Azonexus sp.]
MIDSPKGNRILAALSSDDYFRLLGNLELTRLALGEVLYDSGDRQRYIHFPTTCIVSLGFSTEDGSSAQLAIVGNDGLVGVPMILGGKTTTHSAVVQSAGNAFRLRADRARSELIKGGGLQSLSLLYTQALMTQMAQSVVCNRHHSIKQQLCRWLLLSLDRLPGNQLNVTQELIGHMLGVRREAVTEAAGKLQAAGLIQYSRGRITVIDRAGIEALVCECYVAAKVEIDRLFHLSLDDHDHPRDQGRPDLAPPRHRAFKDLHEQQCR